jgi:release factor glutamine methyltransferase
VDYSQALKWGQAQLSQSGILTSRLDCLVLLEDTLDIDRAKILAQPQTNIEPAVFKQYQKQIIKRSRHIPLAYIRQQSEFYGRVFYIDQRVLEPRPESETIIEELKIILDHTLIAQVLDVGSGSGVLAITTKLEFPTIQVYATDVDKKCLNVIRINAQMHSAQISIFQGDLIKPIKNNFWRKQTLVMANLPYVPSHWQINTSALHEPGRAIFGGPNGLDLYIKLFKQFSDLEHPPIWVITESMPPQHQQLAKIANKSGYSLAKTNDFIQCFSWKFHQELH